MTPWLVAPLAASMLMFSCNTITAPPVSPGPPGTITIHGAIRLAGGAPAFPALVTVDRERLTLATCATDSAGHYRMTVATSKDSVRVLAQEQIQPGVITGAMHYDWVMIVPDLDRRVDLELTREQLLRPVPAATSAR